MQRSTPEEHGISASVIDRFIRALDDEVTDSSHAVHSVMVLRGGHVIGEGWWHPFRVEDRHMLYSLSKSFTATAIGLAVFERRLTVNDKVIDLLPDDLPAAISPNLAAMTVRDLLTMTTGHALDSAPPYAASQSNWARAILEQPIDFLPGTHFVYNSGATYLLSAILHRLTGERLLDYLTPRLLQPLGIVDATWEQCPRGIDVGGWGLSITTEHIAAFGQLLLDGGVSDGRQLVPADWVADATSVQVSNGDNTLADDGTQGYGYQFWRNRHQSYRADGAFGQMSIVIPEHDVIVALTSGHTDAQRLRDIVWDTLLPGLEVRENVEDIGDVGEVEGVDKVDNVELIEGSVDEVATVEALELPHPVGEEHPTSAISGTWMLDTNPLGIESVQLAFVDGATEVRMRAGEAEIALECGYREWRRGSLAAGVGPGELGRGGAIAASGAWVGDQFTAVVWLTETPYAQIMAMTFSSANDTNADTGTNTATATATATIRVDIETRPNVSFADPIVADRMSGHRESSKAAV